jgi:hypothetical protein
MPPLSLTNQQMRAIRRVASTIPLNHRDEFLRRVAAQLAGEPSDAAVHAAIDAQLNLGRVPVFLCDATANAKGPDK